MAEEREQTKVFKSNWDLPLYSWRIEADALNLFIKGLKEKKILGRKCSKCGTVYVPGPTYCRKCMVDIEEVVEVGQEGVIGAFTVNLADIRGNPLPEISIVVCVKLDGADSWLMSRLEGWTDWKEVKSGMRVRIVWKDEVKGALADLDHFELIK